MKVLCRKKNAESHQERAKRYARMTKVGLSMVSQAGSHSAFGHEEGSSALFTSITETNGTKYCLIAVARSSWEI